jgi:phospholipid/cholesterol/gamma-HCH transport system substrate-binding protein
VITRVRRTVAVGLCVVVTSTSCGFGGVNSLPLPGAVASGSGNAVYHVQIANVATLDSNSPVMVDDVVVGSVGHIATKDWHAEVEVRIKPDVAVPANAIATIGQTSLLGSMHLALDPPIGEPPSGRLEPGSTITLNRSSTYPSTEQTLSSLSVVANAGGLGQIGDFVHSTATALSGHEAQIRQLISRLDTFVGTVDAQRDRFVAAIQALDRLTNTLATQKDDITEALRTIPPALDVLLKERPRLVTALQKLGQFSDTTTQFVTTTQDDLVRNLANLGPTLKALADIGPQLGTILAYLPTFPFSQNLIDRGLRGDYFNIFAGLDLTVPRLKRSLFAGTRWGDPNATLVPAPGDPMHFNYTYEPLNAGVNPPPPDGDPGAAVPAAAPAPAPAAGAPPALVAGGQPLLPIAPPASATPPVGPSSPIFAGPYPSPTGGGN